MASTSTEGDSGWIEAAGGGVQSLLGNGWSGSETWGIWGVGKTHELILPVSSDDAGDVELEADVHMALLGGREQDCVDVLTAGITAGTWEFTEAANRAVRRIMISASTLIPPSGLHGPAIARIEFRPRAVDIPAAHNPSSGDTRQLGLALHRLRWRRIATTPDEKQVVVGAPLAQVVTKPAAVRVAAVTFVFNEAINLPIWRRYYGAEVGDRNLFIVDHGSTDGSTDALGDASKIRLPRDELDEHKRCVFMASLQHSLLEYYDYVIYTDCDEIIVPDPSIYGGIQDYLSQTRFEYVAPIGLDLHHIIDRELPLDLEVSIMNQRSFAWFASSLCKPVVSRVPLTWATGFHACDRPIVIDGRLFLFHLKNMDYSIGFRRHKITKEMKWSEGSLAANHGIHARLEFPQYIRQSFLSAVHALDQHGVQPFEFSDEIQRIIKGAELRDGIYHTPHFRGRLVKIPDEFKSKL